MKTVKENNTKEVSNASMEARRKSNDNSWASSTEEEKQDMTRANIPQIPASTSRQKITFQNFLAAEMLENNEKDADRNAKAFECMEVEERYQIEGNAQALNNQESLTRLENQEASGNGSTQRTEVFPGAIRIPGVPIPGAQHENDEEIPNHEHDDRTVPSRSSTLSPVQVEAQLVPETHDIDLLVNERVNRELQERLTQIASQDVQEDESEEAKRVVSAEVVSTNKICFLPRSAFFSVLAVTILAAVVNGVSIGVLRLKASSATSTQKALPTAAPTTTPTVLPTRMLTTAPQTPSPTAASGRTPTSPLTTRGPMKKPTAPPSSPPTVAPSRSATKLQPLTSLEKHVLNAIKQGAKISSLKASDISPSRLTGTIPTEIGSLTKLTSLDLGLNNLTGTIPTELALLTNLTFLSFYSNLLRGSIPLEISLLTSLDYLSLPLNSLTGTIPTELASLSSLTTLWLFSNSFSGTIPSELVALSSLTDLNLSGNKLTGTIHAQLASLASLVWLYLGSNSLKGPIPSKLGPLMQGLSLEANALTGTIPTQIGALTSLGGLYLSNNLIKGPIPSQIGLLVNLFDLYLGPNLLTGTVPTELGRLTGLNIIYLYENNLQQKADLVFCTDHIAFQLLWADCGSTNSLVKCTCCTVCCPKAGTC